MKGVIRKIFLTYISMLMLCTIFIIEIPNEITADLNLEEEWVAWYEGPDSDNEWAFKLAVDEFGNSYVTGISYYNKTGFDFVTVKYDTLGNLLWMARYSGPGNNDDYVKDLVIDSNGNVYITGWTAEKATSSDFVTIAYDTFGNQLWVSRYNSPQNDMEIPRAIALGPSGNVYVTGISANEGSGADCLTIGYDSLGNELWTAMYAGPGISHDRGDGITVDSQDNVIITGFSGESWDRYQLTIKYDSEGNELWTAKFPSADHYYYYNWATLIGVDPLGNVYATGMSYLNISDTDYVTKKYDPDGNLMWEAWFDGPGEKSNDYPRDMVVDSVGNVFVTGISLAKYNRSYTTIAFDTNGDLKWAAIYDEWGMFDCNAIALDSSGNVFVTGTYFSLNSSDDYVTLGYDPNGNQIWYARFNSIYNSVDMVQDIAVDPFGNVYVIGWSIKADGNNCDYVTVKYSPPSIINASINIDPNTLNLKSKGKWITCYIELEEGFDVNEINISSVMLDGAVAAKWGDIQGKTLMVKFSRKEVEDMLSPGTYVFEITGELKDGTKFEGYSDEIRVIDPPKK
jgi:hypothetical protein